uniref:CDP-diacylglycerol--glycerol-3-phosphate 3-phosphatidyltransferase n=1 Tax=Cacopsylla melanoneura TaxID=428564 RepID=A0A8D9ACU7_9HEMI
MLPKRWDFVSKLAPVFPARSDQIKLLSQPNEFYSELLGRIQNAKTRIVLTSLYMGTGPLEEKLVQTLQSTLLNNQAVNVRILLDANRGTRGEINSQTLLTPIVSQFSQHCNVAFYHTPDLRWPLSSLLPHRYNELVGLQHMKFYLIDNSVIITGANLSSDYFTNRQDRYILIEDHRQLSDFFDDLSRVLSKISFQLRPNGISGEAPSSQSSGVSNYQNLEGTPSSSRSPISRSEGAPSSSPGGSLSSSLVMSKEFESLSPVSPTKRDEYVERSRSLVMEMYNSYRNKQEPQPSDAGPPNTWLAPLIECPPLSIAIDSTVTKQVIHHALDGSSLHLGTGYFNLTQDYVRAILAKPSVQYSVLMAHPTANGFLNARGVAGGIPYAYTALAAQFLSQVSALKLSMFEYIRKGWTYHAKGLWYADRSDDPPILTLIGSSNFGERSVRRDLECSLLILSEDVTLHTRLEQEKRSLFESSEAFTLDTARRADRKPPLWVQGVLALFRYYF